MPCIHLKLLNWRSQNFSNLSKIEKFISRLGFGELQLTQISLNFQTFCCVLKIRDLGPKLSCCSNILLLKEIMTFWSQRVHAFPWTKIKTLIKMRQIRKWKIPDTILERWTLCLNSYNNRKLKIKLWRIGTHETSWNL